jgi:hypothetical protein
VKTIVVDLGCVDHSPSETSLKTLVEEYKPDLVFGFDPLLELPLESQREDDTSLILCRAAAWLHDGTAGFVVNGNGSRVQGDNGSVACFDFSRWLSDLRTSHPRPDVIVVKMDIEGAEVPIVQRMIEDGTDKLIDELLVEWHGAGEELEERLSCRVRRWWM